LEDLIVLVLVREPFETMPRAGMDILEVGRWPKLRRVSLTNTPLVIASVQPHKAAFLQELQLTDTDYDWGENTVKYEGIQCFKLGAGDTEEVVKKASISLAACKCVEGYRVDVRDVGNMCDCDRNAVLRGLLPLATKGNVCYLRY
jgi:hypothetical protein